MDTLRVGYPETGISHMENYQRAAHSSWKSSMMMPSPSQTGTRHPTHARSLTPENSATMKVNSGVSARSAMLCVHFLTCQMREREREKKKANSCRLNITDERPSDF